MSTDHRYMGAVTRLHTMARLYCALHAHPSHLYVLVKECEAHPAAFFVERVVKQTRDYYLPKEEIQLTLLLLCTTRRFCAFNSSKEHVPRRVMSNPQIEPHSALFADTLHRGRHLGIECSIMLHATTYGCGINVRLKDEESFSCVIVDREKGVASVPKSGVEQSNAKACEPTFTSSPPLQHGPLSHAINEYLRCLDAQLNTSMSRIR
jgi:hypothetical protein